MSSVPLDRTAGAGENTRFIILISCVATIGGFLFGFDSGVISGKDRVRSAPMRHPPALSSGRL
ncbi:hypothetical protein [Xanthomonas theicola]|uniref:Major facilitator superfamily (MFS) profile domain-containing protein n=1 Tax=Xanthomonas theicola TaxID=56464 RepID=A0A2S6ZC92_9XANT|nr:hypothetical protein [Xanthomonas theicola]PPT86598.1 hypothetical protein XthCFBP4691_16070 [Xanthomonas theicola]QNH23485.1 sugar porter family MFS transporter [Xanthomonas theicola]